ncbi:MAG: DHHA1 domain-containing protein [archaeon]
MDPKESFRQYITSLDPKDRIAILHHTDSDGITAGLIAKKSTELITGLEISIHFHQKEGKIPITKNTIAFVKKNNINKLIIVDLAIDHDPQPVKDLEKHAKILLIDHHEKTHDINSKNTTMIKAQDLSDIPSDKYPASKLCYDLFSDLADIKNLSWLAAIGIWGDYAQSQWPDFLKKTGIKESRLEQADELIFYSGSIKGADGLTRSFDIIDKSETIDDIIKNPELNTYKDTVMAELDNYLDIHRTKADFHGNLIIYEIEPKHRIKSRLINILSQKYYPDRTIVLIQLDGDRAAISARRQDSKYSMNAMLKHALKDIPDSQGGGHIPAAGGYLPAQYLEKFRQQVISYCKEKDLQ